jgi:hypothetical protein
MNAYCPECETELEPISGICPACRWESGFSKGYGTVRSTQTNEGSISERYRGTAYDASVHLAQAANVEPSVSRGRLFVVVGVVIGIVVYGVVLTSMAHV